MKTRRDLREEAEFLPDTIDELLELRERVMAAGESRRTADGLCMWVLAKRNGEADTTGAKIRANYRKILRRIGELEPTGPARRGATRGDDGYAELKTAAQMALGAVVSLAVAHVTGNPAALALTPVIPADESYVESGLSTAWDELEAA